MADLADRLARVRARISEAAVRAGRSPGEVTLVVVTKGFPADRVADLGALGVADVGENRAREMLAKQAALARDPRAAAVRWHFVGRLQRNKARSVVGRAVLVHSLDSAGLAEEISRRAVAAGLRQDALIEVNVSGEPTKAGVSPAGVAALAAEVTALPGIRLRGLMTIAPEGSDPEAARPVFRDLRHIRDRLAERNPEFRELSMGMSADFEVAVEEGATLVRVGTAILGPR